MSLRREIQLMAHDYVRKGGKQNRRKQAKRMLALCSFAESMGCRDFGEFGKRHVIEFWKSHRDLSEPVQYQHWLAFRELWQRIGKAGEPPKPRIIEKNDPS